MHHTVATLVENPLASWANDDLLFAEETHAFFAKHHSAALHVLDWPELRARFQIFDRVANAARRNSRRGGMQAALVGFASLAIGAVTPVVSFNAPTWSTVALGAISAFLAVFASSWGYFQLLTGRRKSQWLTNRFWTERLRQLHFQFILNNLQLAVEMMRDPTKRAEWDRRRAEALDEFELRIVRPVTAAYKRMRDDVAEEEFWVTDAWQTRPSLPLPSPELDEIFDLLNNQRFDIQRRFTNLKTSTGIFSPVTRSATVRTTSDIMTLFTLIATLISGLLLTFGIPVEGEGSLPMKAVTASLALASATVILLRVLNEGLQLSSEAERYGWYCAAVTALQGRFSKGDVADKIDVLREMERLSYQEMRWFLNAFHDARFVI